MSWDPYEIKKWMAREYLEAAELFAKSLDLERAQKYVEKAVKVLEKETSVECLPCKEKKAENLLSIIEELKRVIG